MYIMYQKLTNDSTGAVSMISSIDVSFETFSFGLYVKSSLHGVKVVFLEHLISYPDDDVKPEKINYFLFFFQNNKSTIFMFLL